MSDVPDDHTIRVRRSWPGNPPSADENDDIDEVTEVSRRRIASSTAEIALPMATAHDSAPSDSVSADSASADSARESTAASAPDVGRDDDEAPLRHRATYIHTADPVGQTDGSTIVARRESRRRASREAEDEDLPDDTLLGARRAVLGGHHSGAGSAPQGSRTAQESTANEVYPVRKPGHIIAEHLDVGAHPPQSPVDGAAEATARRRTERRTTLIVVAAASIVVIAAVAALIALLLSR